MADKEKEKVKQNNDYGIDIQKLYLEIMLKDAETFVRCQSIFNPKNFDSSLRSAADFVNDYVLKYNAMPKYEMVNSATKVKLQDPGDLQKEHFEWMMDEFETFTRHKTLEAAILKSADLLEKGEYGSVEDLIKKAVQIGLQKDLGTDYWAAPRARLESIKSANGQVSSGWKNLDDKLYGGFNKGELNIFAGGSGAGKSLFLANLAVNWALQGMNVVYLTFELSENLVGMRIDSMVTSIPNREIFKSLDDVEMKVKVIGKKSGAIQIKYMPSGKNANDIRSYIKEYEIKTGTKVDAVLVDYLDLLMPLRVKVSAENLFIKDKYVSEELRDLAMELNTLFITASQLNRSSVEEVEFDHSHISGGLSKIQTADNVIGIYTSKAMRERGKYQLQLMKTRNSSGVNSKIDLDFDIDTLRITAPAEDSAPAASSNVTGTSILDGIRRNKKTATDFLDTTMPITEDISSPGAAVQSSQLRNFINNIKT